jgi:drug/metabolite transporter (DMT)-like permease
MVWWRSQTSALRGTLLLLVAMVFFTIMLLLIRIAGQRLPVLQVLVVRQVVMQLLIFAYAGRRVKNLLRTSNPRLQILRGVISLGATCATFIAVIYLPLALATAISFTYAIFVTLGAALFLKESVNLGRWAAAIIGLIGVVIMLSPTEQGGLPFILVALGGAVLSAGMILTVRGLDPDEPIETVLTYQGLLVVPVLIIPMLLTWQAPTLEEWGILVLIGLTGTIGQWLLINAYQQAEASILAPLDFVRLLLMTACGLLFFGETPNLSLLVGVVIVLGTTIFTVRSNAHAARPGGPEPGLGG